MRYVRLVGSHYNTPPDRSFYFFTSLPSCSCEWISLDPHSHDQHIHDNKAHRLFNFSISFLAGHVVRSHWILAHRTNIFYLHWTMVAYLRQSPLLLWEKVVVSTVIEEATVRY